MRDTLLVFILVIFNSFTPAKRHETEKVTVTGIAGNARAGAVVTKDKIVYYIDGIRSWPDTLIGSHIRVTGKLKVVRNPRAEGPEQRGSLREPCTLYKRQDATWWSSSFKS